MHLLVYMFDIIYIYIPIIPNPLCMPLAHPDALLQRIFQQLRGMRPAEATTKGTDRSAVDHHVAAQPLTWAGPSSWAQLKELTIINQQYQPFKGNGRASEERNTSALTLT